MNLNFLRFGLVYGVRSLLRNGRRSLLLFLTVGLAVASGLVAKSYADAVFAFWVESTVETGLGHAQIHKRGFWGESTGLERQYCLAEESDIEKMLLADHHVDGYSRRLSVEGLVSTGNRSIYFNGVGLEADKEMVVSPRLSSFEGNAGTFLRADYPSGVAIGKGLSESLGVGVGDPLSLTVQTLDGALNAVDVVVIGIVDYPVKQISKRLIYLNFNLAQELMQMHGLYTEIALRINSDTNLSEWAATYTKPLAALQAEVRPWWEVLPPMRRIEAIMQQVVSLICLLLFLSAGLSVLSIVFLTINERTIEIGILMALGAKGSQIRRLLGIEAILVGCIGGVIGLVVGNVLITLAYSIGLPLPNPLFRGYIYIKPEADLVYSVMALSLAVVLSAFAVLLPAYKASQVEPVVAFRGQI